MFHSLSHLTQLSQHNQNQYRPWIRFAGSETKCSLQTNWMYLWSLDINLLYSGRVFVYGGLRCERASYWPQLKCCLSMDRRGKHCRLKCTSPTGDLRLFHGDSDFNHSIIARLQCDWIPVLTELNRTEQSSVHHTSHHTHYRHNKKCPHNYHNVQIPVRWVCRTVRHEARVSRSTRREVHKHPRVVDDLETLKQISTRLDIITRTTTPAHDRRHL